MEKMLHVIQRYSVMLVTGNMVAIDKRGNRSKKTFDRLQAKDSCNYMLNISRIFGGKASYYGCAMAANLLKSNVHLEYTVLEHRLHGNNVTKSHRKLGKRLHSRILFARALGELSIRIIKHRIIQGGE